LSVPSRIPHNRFVSPHGPVGFAPIEKDALISFGPS
jgi:hypothetical protein